MPLYLGFDLSTQGLTALVVDGDARRVILEHWLAFDSELAEYGTRAGVLRSADPRVVHTPPGMWAAALDRMCGALASRLDLSRIRAVSGSAQQHGSVYLNTEAARVLPRLDPAAPLAPQIETIFSRRTSPVWLDCSTSGECAAIAATLGGSAAVAALTGSRPFERFTAAQIRKFALQEPDAYARTARIHLVSSFMASLLTGGDAPIEPADASGMNLMDLASRSWSQAALDATAPDLERRLPRIVDSQTVVGPVSEYWRRRFGFGDAAVVAWTGDNPSSLVGLGLTRIGHVAISLGTSDTIFGPCDCAAAGGAHEGHVFASPVGGCMALVCFANGSLTREHVRDLYGVGWPGFSALLRQTPAGSGGALMLPWAAPEITPPVARPGLRRRGFDGSDAARNIRALVEGQALAMRAHSSWIARAVRSVHATGGAARNPELLQIVADVFDASVVRVSASNTAALGAALRAFHGDAAARGAPVGWADVVAGLTDPRPDSIIEPIAAHAALYRARLREYEAFERESLDGI